MLAGRPAARSPPRRPSRTVPANVGQKIAAIGLDERVLEVRPHGGQHGLVRLVRRLDQQDLVRTCTRTPHQARCPGRTAGVRSVRAPRQHRGTPRRRTVQRQAREHAAALLLDPRRLGMGTHSRQDGLMGRVRRKRQHRLILGWTALPPQRCWPAANPHATQARRSGAVTAGCYGEPPMRADRGNTGQPKPTRQRAARSPA